MARPCKTFPFEDLRVGRTRRFSVPEYTSAELAVLVKAAYRRRNPDGSKKYATKAKADYMGYEWVEVTRLSMAEPECPE